MENNISPIVSLHDLLVYECKKVSAAESQLQQALPAWTAKAGSQKLKDLLTVYVVLIGHNGNEISNFFRYENPSALPAQSAVIRAFISETNEKLNACADSEVADACLLSAIQEINHYKISIYGSAAAFANTLGQVQLVGLLHKAENDEKRMDRNLTEVAEHTVNELAKVPLIK